MHKLAERTELEALVKMGVLQGDVEEMMKVCTASRLSNFGFPLSVISNATRKHKLERNC
jgi:hypothetical protein